MTCINQYNKHLKVAVKIHLQKRTYSDVGWWEDFTVGYCPAQSPRFPMMPQLMEHFSWSAEALRGPPRSTGLSSASGRLLYCLRNNYWTAETQSNISPVSAPLLSSTPPEAWLPNHLKYDMNEARGAGAYAWITNRGYKFHACSFFFCLPLQSP